MADTQNIKDEYFEELCQKLDILYYKCLSLEAQNKALHEENKMLIDYITKIGIKIKTELCTSYDYRNAFETRFKRVDLERCSFYVQEPEVERTKEFLSMLKNGEALPPFRFNSYHKHFMNDFSDFSDMDMIEYKYQREVGVK